MGKTVKKDFTIEDAKEILVSKMKKLSERDAGYRDLSVLFSAFVKMEKDLGKTAESQWWKDLRDLKEASSGIEELVLDYSDEKYKQFFENGKKKEIFLKG